MALEALPAVLGNSLAQAQNSWLALKVWLQNNVGKVTMPTRAQSNTVVSTASLAYVALAGGPEVTVPRTGYYIVAYGALLWNNAAGGESYMAPSHDVETGLYCRTNDGAPTTVNNHLPATKLTAGQVIGLRYRSTGGNTLNAQWRWIELIPVRDP